jgi:hypothetical protein
LVNLDLETSPSSWLPQSIIKSMPKTPVLLPMDDC